MHWKNIFSLEKIRQQFDWTPVAVRVPRPRFVRMGADNARFLLGYVVEIEYKYHKSKSVFFPAKYNDDTLQRRGSVALRDAISLYRQTKQKIVAAKKYNNENFK